jgi:hypothetical protein
VERDMRKVKKYARKVKKNGKNRENFLIKWKSTENESRRKRKKHVHTETNGSTSVYADTFSFTALHKNPPQEGVGKFAALHRRSA